MNHDPDPGHDKLDLHQRQQLSALVDGELAPDQARFLLRRLQHDAELSGSAVAGPDLDCAGGCGICRSHRKRSCRSCSGNFRKGLEAAFRGKSR